MKLMDKKTHIEYKNRQISAYFGITRLPQNFYLEIKNAVYIDLCGQKTYWSKIQNNMTILDVKRNIISLTELISLNPKIGHENRKEKFWEYLIVMQDG